ncbi:MAG: hypothetical protein ABIR69_09590 [Nitrospiraceae bacterium]|jgi:hypothetical protein
MRSKACWTVADEGRGAVIAPKDEAEFDEGYHDAEHTRLGKIKPVLHLLQDPNK